MVLRRTIIKKPTSTIWAIDFMVSERAKYESAPMNSAIDSNLGYGLELESF
jgi:hypothetical protein